MIQKSEIKDLSPLFNKLLESNNRTLQQIYCIAIHGTNYYKVSMNVSDNQSVNYKSDLAYIDYQSDDLLELVIKEMFGSLDNKSQIIVGFVKDMNLFKNWGYLHDKVSNHIYQIFNDIAYINETQITEIEPIPENKPGYLININQITQLSHVFKELYKRSNSVYQSIYCQYCLMSQYYETRIDKDTHNKHLEYIFDQTENLMGAIRSSAGLRDEDDDKDYELYDKAYAGIQSDIKLFTDWGYLPGNKSNELCNIWNIFKDFEDLKYSLEKLFR